MSFIPSERLQLVGLLNIQSLCAFLQRAILDFLSEMSFPKLLEVFKTLIFLLFVVNVKFVDSSWKREEDKTKCPKVKGLANFDISQFLGSWKIIQYYASSEEALAYKCMRAELSGDYNEVTMNFTYSFVDDPINERVFGNITWKIPNYNEFPAHWIHAEYPYEGEYNTYVLATDYKSWALLMHCAEKEKSERYLSSLIMSRKKNLGPNVISYLREKLPKYDIDLDYMFPMEQVNCNHTTNKKNSYLTLPMVEAARNIYDANEHLIIEN